MKWLTWKTGGIAASGVIALLLVVGLWSTVLNNSDLKKQLADKVKEAEDAKKQVADISTALNSRLDSLQKQLTDQRNESEARIAQLQTALNANAAIRQAAASAYQQQHQATQAQLAQVATAPTAGLVQTLANQLKVPQDTFSVLSDRVQVGNDSFRAITQRVVECRDISDQNTNLQVQVTTLQKDKDTQAATIQAQTTQINTLIDGGNQLRNDIKKQLDDLNTAHQREISAKDAQIATLTKDLKKERSFFGNLGRTAKKVGIGVAVGLGIGAFLGI